MDKEPPVDLQLTVKAHGIGQAVAAAAASYLKQMLEDSVQRQRLVEAAREFVDRSPATKQTTLDPFIAELDPVLADMERNAMFNPRAFFDRFIWPQDRSLREGQKNFVSFVNAALRPLVGQTWSKGCLFEMPTGAGKSIAVDYLSVLAAETHIRAGRTGSVKSSLIVAVPTIALAHEAHARLYDKWAAYGYAAVKSGAELTICPPISIAACRGGRDIPLVPIKLLAGNSDTQGIVVRASRNAGPEAGTNAEGTTGTTAIAFVVVCTFEHALQLLQAHARQLPPPFGGPLRPHIGALVINEAHYVTELSRSATAALHCWA
jgi:hypothetical protein